MERERRRRTGDAVTEGEVMARKREATRRQLVMRARVEGTEERRGDVVMMGCLDLKVAWVKRGGGLAFGSVDVHCFRLGGV